MIYFYKFDCAQLIETNLRFLELKKKGYSVLTSFRKIMKNYVFENFHPNLKFPSHNRFQFNCYGIQIGSFIFDIGTS